MSESAAMVLAHDAIDRAIKVRCQRTGLHYWRPMEVSYTDDRILVKARYYCALCHQEYVGNGDGMTVDDVWASDRGWVNFCLSDDGEFFHAMLGDGTILVSAADLEGLVS